MVDPLIVPLLKYLNIFLAVSEESKVVTVLQFENSLGLEFHFIELVVG